MKLFFFALTFTLTGTSALALGQRCAPGYDTPDVVAGFCKFYSDPQTCQQANCEWQVYNNCQPNDPNSVLAGFCKLQNDPQSCLQSPANCSWIP